MSGLVAQAQIKRVENCSQQLSLNGQKAAPFCLCQLRLLPSTHSTPAAGLCPVLAVEGKPSAGIDMFIVMLR